MRQQVGLVLVDMVPHGRMSVELDGLVAWKPMWAVVKMMVLCDRPAVGDGEGESYIESESVD